MDGLPLLSHTPPQNSDGSDDTTCRKCDKEFNFLFSRPKRCHHCGYAYCSSCADFEALMPRGGSEAGYDLLPVCAYCIDMLTVTASGKTKLRSLPLPKLRAYMKAYNIATGSGALEKDDLVDAIMHAKGPNGCLLQTHEEYYRHNSVPRKSGERQRTRSFFSRPPPSVSSHRPRQPDPPPVPPRPPVPPPHMRTNNSRTNPSPSNPTSSPQMPSPQSHAYRQSPPPPQSSYRDQRFPPQHDHTSPSATRQPNANSRPSASQTNFHVPPSSPPHHGNRQPPSRSPQPPQPPPRPQSAAPTVSGAPAASRPPVPSLDALLHLRPNEISQLSISTLKTVLFENRVNISTGVLEKEDLVHKVLALVDDERRNREIAEKETREEAERMEWAKREEEKQEEERNQAEREWKQEEERLGNNQANPAPSTSASTSSNIYYTEKTQDGICVICCDAYANMAIIDCGHLALCKECSEIVMKTTRECPLCRTRIVTEQRLLRIFKS